MAWLLLAVFVALAGLTAVALARAGPAPERAGLRRPGRLVGASVTTAVRRMDDLTLAARTLLGSRPDTHQRASSPTGIARWASTSASAASPASATSSSCARPRADVYPPGERPYYCLPRLGVAGPGMDDTLERARRPGPRPLPAHQPARRHARLGRVLRVRRHLQRRPRDVRGRRARSTAAAASRRRCAPAARRATGWIVGLFDAEPILRSSVARQAGVAVSLAREHAAVPEIPHPDRRRRRVPHALGDACTPRRSPASARSRRHRAEPAHLGRGRRPLDRVGHAAPRPRALRPRGPGHARARDLARARPARLPARAGARPRPRPRAADGRGEDRPAAPPGAARRAHRACPTAR